MDKYDILNIFSVIFGTILSYLGFMFLLDTSQCMQSNIIWDSCRNEVRSATILEIIILGVNTINIYRVLNRYNKIENYLR